MSTTKWSESSNVVLITTSCLSSQSDFMTEAKEDYRPRMCLPGMRKKENVAEVRFHELGAPGMRASNAPPELLRRIPQRRRLERNEQVSVR
ncbi:hypothetical protein IWX46DRAFT_624823 [Phyllosticta citricarpa]|uniref:Uncharacterized protein n=1 Tax=Phyllosticta citricarpa TaxID=55181 RepID=A0ABR1MML4_9PEZI